MVGLTNKVFFMADSSLVRFMQKKLYLVKLQIICWSDDLNFVLIEGLGFVLIEVLSL